MHLNGWLWHINFSCRVKTTEEMEAEELARVPKFKARPLDKRVRGSTQWCYEFSVSLFHCRLAWFLAIASDQLFCVSRYSRAGVTSDCSGIINAKLHYPPSFTSRLANALKFAARLYHLRSLARYIFSKCSPDSFPVFSFFPEFQYLFSSFITKVFLAKFNMC